MDRISSKMNQGYTVADYKSLLKDPCPWCGEAVVIRKGRYGEFVACQEWCGYTKSIPGRSDYPPPSPKTKCPYSKCNGSGLLPFTKNGGVIPFVSVHCDCYYDKTQERFQDVSADCFDYPMSSTYRAASFEYCGMPDHGRTIAAPTPPPEQVIIHRHSNMSKLEGDLLQQTARGLEHVSKTLKEHLNWKKENAGKGFYDSV